MLHFIFNPIAGHGISQKKFKELEELLKKRGIEYTVSCSEYPGHSHALTQQAVKDGREIIVAAGGDGTVREVAHELVGKGVTMGIFPCGTGNDLARALNIPQDTIEALDVLLNGEAREIDAAKANDDLYFNVAGFGFDVDVLINTERFKKRFKGLTAYVLGLFSALFGLKLSRVRITSPEETFECSALLVAACNGTHFGGGMNVAPKADPSDGLLDICVISDVTRLTVISVLSKFIKGRHLALPMVKYFKTTQISVESERPLQLQLDGEVIGSTPVTFKVLPKALLIKTGKTP